MNTDLFDSVTVQNVFSSYCKKPRPWSSKVPPKQYGWKSSIPDSWFKLAGNNKFAHTSDRSTLKCTGYNLNYSKEFLHQLTLKRPMRSNTYIETDIRKKSVKLRDIVKDFDLANQNKYVAEKIKRRKVRSQNSTPFKKRLI